MNTQEWKNKLYFGDNLGILRDHIPDESVDLIYLDPPFNSQRLYNAFFDEQDGSRSKAQVAAFTDAWAWEDEAKAAYFDVTTSATAIGVALSGLHDVLGTGPMLSYLSIMALRLMELHRALKPSGTLYLHCDPTASHYLKILLDALFGSENFRNEIVWQRTAAKAHATRSLPSNHDVILLYAKSSNTTWCSDAMFVPYDLSNLPTKTARKYCHLDSDGRRYRLDNLLNPNPNRPNLTYEFLGVTRVWRWTKERMQKAYEAGLVIQTAPGRVPQLKRYLDEQRGLPICDVWGDISPLNSQARERLGYPTQKPEALLHRIISLSSNPGGVILDPFCGCGTAVSVAEEMGRKWIGIDIAFVAISLIKQRLAKAFGRELSEYVVEGMPKTLADAKAMAASEPDGRFQFQWWAVDQLSARPQERKKGADSGVDGLIFFHDDNSGSPKKILIQVKSGKVGRRDIATLRGDMEAQNAVIGVFVTLTEPTKPMKDQAFDAGMYIPVEFKSTPVSAIQIITAQEILDGRGVEYYALQRATFEDAPSKPSKTRPIEKTLGK